MASPHPSYLHSLPRELRDQIYDRLLEAVACSDSSFNHNDIAEPLIINRHAMKQLRAFGSAFPKLQSELIARLYLPGNTCRFDFDFQWTMSDFFENEIWCPEAYHESVKGRYTAYGPDWGPDPIYLKLQMVIESMSHHRVFPCCFKFDFESTGDELSDEDNEKYREELSEERPLPGNVIRNLDVTVTNTELVGWITIYDTEHDNNLLQFHFRGNGDASLSIRLRKEEDVVSAEKFGDKNPHGRFTVVGTIGQLGLLRKKWPTRIG